MLATASSVDSRNSHHNVDFNHRLNTKCSWYLNPKTVDFLCQGWQEKIQRSPCSLVISNSSNAGEAVTSQVCKVQSNAHFKTIKCIQIPLIMKGRWMGKALNWNGESLHASVEGCATLLVCASGSRVLCKQQGVGRQETKQVPRWIYLHLDLGILPLFWAMITGICT